MPKFWLSSLNCRNYFCWNKKFLFRAINSTYNSRLVSKASSKADLS